MTDEPRKIRHIYRPVPLEEEKRLADLADKIDREESTEIKREARHLHEAHQRIRAMVAVLKSERQRQGISLTIMSERTGIDEDYLDRLEHDNRVNPAFDLLERFAEALGKEIQMNLGERAA